MSTPQDPQYPQYPQGGSSGGQPGQPSSGGSSAAPPPDQGGYTPPGQYPAPGQYPSAQSGGGYPETGGQAYTPPGQYPQPGGYGQYPPGGSAPEQYGQYPPGGSPQEQYGQYPGGGMPPAPGGYGGDTAPATRPQEVDRSFFAWLGYSVLGLLPLFTVFSDDSRTEFRTEAERSLRESGQTISDSALDNLVTASLVVGVLIAAALILIPLLFAFLMRQRPGRNWARIVLAVVGGIAILLSLLGIGAGGFSSAVAIVQVILGIAGLVFAFHPKSNPWFQKRRAY